MVFSYSGKNKQFTAHENSLCHPVFSLSAFLGKNEWYENRQEACNGPLMGYSEVVMSIRKQFEVICESLKTNFQPCFI